MSRASDTKDEMELIFCILSSKIVACWIRTVKRKGL
jgi:hypothetical protein